MGDPPNSTNINWLRRIKPFVQVCILVLVIWGIWRTISDARAKFAEADFAPSQLDITWLLAAAVLYALGMLPCCCFWKHILEAMGQRPGWLETARAFYVGHLAKYVPGKALVVVLRTGLIRSSRVDVAVAAASVFVETLTMMAVGATVAAVILGLVFRQHQALLLLAIFLALCAGLPTWPPLFRMLIRWLQIRRANPQIDQAVAGLDLRLMAFGWLTITLGWTLLGLSLWATIKAIPNAQIGHPLSELPLLTASVALALVAGFLSLLPGGVLVREFVVMTLLAPVFGEVTAIVSAVALRVVWLASEAILAVVLFPMGGRRAER